MKFHRRDGIFKRGVKHSNSDSPLRSWALEWTPASPQTTIGTLLSVCQYVNFRKRSLHDGKNQKLILRFESEMTFKWHCDETAVFGIQNVTAD